MVTACSLLLRLVKVFSDPASDAGESTMRLSGVFAVTADCAAATRPLVLAKVFCAFVVVPVKLATVPSTAASYDPPTLLHAFVPS